MKLLGVTSCPMGIAHTYMAAEALQIAAEEMGHSIKVETHGAIGVENEISEKEIIEADAVIIAADKAVDKTRFQDKIIVEVPTQEAVKNANEIVNKVVAQVEKRSGNSEIKQEIEAVHGENKCYKHMMTGISFMVPFLVISGVFTSLSQFIKVFDKNSALLDILNKISINGAYEFLLPILSGYISYSVADTLGIAPGIITGYIAWKMGMGFFGALVSGFLCGYIARLIKKYVKLPQNLVGLLPSVIIPLVSTFIAAFILIYIVGIPLEFINKGIVSWLSNIGKVQGALLGIALGAMMAVDAGGPINKAAYTFAVAALTMGEQKEMAAVMAAGMVPPIAMGLASLMFKNKFTHKEINAGIPAIVLGTAFVTEGVMPYITLDAKKVLPSIILGSSVASVLSMTFNCTVSSPLGGIYIFIIPNVVGNIVLYLASIVAGIIISMASIILLKSRFV